MAAAGVASTRVSRAHESTASSSDAKFSTDVKVVNVLVAVRDTQGRIISDLTEDDFELSEEGYPRTIRYFTRETDAPLTLGLLVDTSLSQRRVLGEEKDASRRFIEKVLREDRDQTFEGEPRNRYSLGFTPAKTDGFGFHKIAVTVKQKGLIVQTREGYYPGS